MKLTAMSLLVALGLITLGDDTLKTCSGRVVDFNSPKNNPIGLDGVEVTAYDPAKTRVLATAQTDGAGDYTLEGIGAGDYVIIEHEKEYYLNAPETFKGVIPRETMIIKMARKPRESAFYTKMGEAIANRVRGASEVKAMEEEWVAFRYFDYSLEERAMVKDEISKELGSDTLINSIDARITARQLKDKDPQVALEVARREGILKDILFSNADATITPDMAKLLETTAAFIGEVPFGVIIEGYADLEGTNEYNMTLSERRANAALTWLTQVGGVDPGKIETRAYGEERPVCVSTDEACRAQNRRISYALDVHASSQNWAVASRLPATPREIAAAVDAAYAKYKDIKAGANADYIPALANVDSKIYGIVLVTTDGKVYTAGDIKSAISIQSISKVFTMAKVMEEQGPDAIAKTIGVDATGMRFNSIVAVEMALGGPEMNPLVNPGAIAVTSMVKGANRDEIWNSILAFYSDFAGRPLTVDQEVFKLEADTNQRNQAIGYLMHAYGFIKEEPVRATDVYTEQLSVAVNAKDLALMAATLANHGKNPVTGKQVMKAENVPEVLAVMATAGLHDDSGKWLYRTGLPATGGVSGGFIAVSPGKFGIAVVSPPLDEGGNSVRAQKAIADISKALGGNPYAR